MNDGQVEEFHSWDGKEVGRTHVTRTINTS
jgi:hypothetical protein